MKEERLSTLYTKPHILKSIVAKEILCEGGMPLKREVVNIMHEIIYHLSIGRDVFTIEMPSIEARRLIRLSGLFHEQDGFSYETLKLKLK